MRSLLFVLALALGITACSNGNNETSRWTKLFDGETLDGWFVHHGDLPFELRNGEIVGATAKGIPTRYLTSVDQYDDFILKLEMNNADGENSGVQFRSVTDGLTYTGLTGYQLEVDPSERGWTVGIFFEGVRTWQHPPIHNPQCKAAWRKDDWNDLRIEAKGELLRTFVNDVACAYLFDQYLGKGHIGLQIHSIGSLPGEAGAETRWRNIRILANPNSDDYTPADMSADSNSHLIGRLSPTEKVTGWTLVRSQTEPASAWSEQRIENPIDGTGWTADVAKISADDGPSSLHIPVSGKSYHLIADVQITPGTSGEIFYPLFGDGPENTVVKCMASYRIFDDRSLEKRSRNDPNLMGSLTGLIPAKNLSEPNRGKRVLTDNAWRRIELKIQAEKVEHWLNAVKSLEYQGCHSSMNTSQQVEPKIKISLDTGQVILRTIKMKSEV
ncbi:MAG: DUF1080 domain-containing protein [Acidimicrobiales bacterium]|nr:MAG: DUF1080 domain-containing protein [Acidimicrobiales bacterium]